jgi:hypothetical protein
MVLGFILVVFFILFVRWTAGLIGPCFCFGCAVKTVLDDGKIASWLIGFNDKRPHDDAPVDGATCRQTGILRSAGSPPTGYF